MEMSSENHKICGKCKDEKQPIKAKGLCNKCYTAECRRKQKEANKENDSVNAKNHESNSNRGGKNQETTKLNDNRTGGIKKKRHTVTVFMTDKWKMDEMNMHAALSEENIELVERGCFYEAYNAKLEVNTDKDKTNLKEFVEKAGGKVFDSTCEDFTEIVQFDMAQNFIGIEQLNRELDRIKEKCVFEVRAVHIRTWHNEDQKTKEKSDRRVAYIYVKKIKEEPFEWSSEMKRVYQNKQNKGSFYQKTDPTKAKVVFMGIESNDKAKEFFSKVESTFQTTIKEFFEVGKKQDQSSKTHIGVLEVSFAKKLVKWKFLPFEGKRISIREFLPRKQFEQRKERLQEKRDDGVAMNKHQPLIDTKIGSDDGDKDRQQQQTQSSQHQQKQEKSSSSSIKETIDKNKKTIDVEAEKQKILEYARKLRRKSEVNKLQEVDANKMKNNEEALQKQPLQLQSKPWGLVMEQEEEAKRNSSLSSDQNNSQTTNHSNTHINIEMSEQQQQQLQAQRSPLFGSKQ